MKTDMLPISAYVYLYWDTKEKKFLAMATLETNNKTIWLVEENENDGK